MKPLKTLLLLLALSLPTLAESWELLEPEMPVVGRSGESVLFRLKGPQAHQPFLKLSGETVTHRLVEVSPGNYQTALSVPQDTKRSLFLVDAETGLRRRLGTLQASSHCGQLRVTSEMVTRQGPHPDYDRLTPLYPGQHVALDGIRGGWYRLRASQTWVDGRKSPLSETDMAAFLPPNRLKRIRVEQAPNGDALLKLEMTRSPEIQAIQTGQALQFHLYDTLQTNFDIRRPSGVATFLGPILLRPCAQPQGVIVEINEGIKYGYQIIPELETGELTLRLRKPLPASLEGLKITVDAGHGGLEDRGTVGHLGLEEKVLNLRVAEALAEKLRQLGAEVTMTRLTDKAVLPESAGAGDELQSRIDHSIKRGSQLFLSVHHNARPSVEQGKIYHGTDIYWYQPHSQSLARHLADPIADAIGEESRSFRWRSFYVIRQTHSPAVLMEFQYLSNPVLEKSVLSQPDYPEKASSGVVEGLRNYLEAQASER